MWCGGDGRQGSKQKTKKMATLEYEAIEKCKGGCGGGEGGANFATVWIFITVYFIFTKIYQFVEIKFVNLKC